MTQSIAFGSPALVDCSACSGTGELKGLFNPNSCAACDGNGILDAKTGQLITKERMVILQRKKIQQLQMQVGYFKSQCDSQEQGHWEEFKAVAGGKQRLD